MNTSVGQTVVFGAGQWSELRAFIDLHFGQGFANTDPVCRGEPDCYPSVLSVIDRLLTRETTAGGMAGRLRAEVDGMVRFCQHAPMHLDPLQQQMLKEGIQAQTVMRHYGAPTRLLDWTESPWIALYFACEDAGQPPRTAPTTGRVLAFDRTQLERAITKDFAAEATSHADLGTLPDGTQAIKMLTPRFVEDAREWVVCYHRHAEKFPRLVAQQGLFTIASKPWLDHWATVKALCPGSHNEIRIEPGLKAEVLRRLAKMGITAATLFPDIEGVAREIGSHLRMYHT